MRILESSSNHLAEVSLASKLLQSNIIMITDEIDSYTTAEYQEQLLYLKSKCKPGETITIVINSPGGSVYNGLGIIDLIQSIKDSGINVRTKVIGAACSMASIILMSGTKGMRESTPNSTIMVHEMSSYEFGKVPDLEDSVNELKRLQEIVNQIYTTQASEQLIVDCYRKDLWVSPKDALKYNIIDKITL